MSSGIHEKLGIRGKFLLISTLSIALCALSVFMVSLKEHEAIYIKSVENNLEALTTNVADDLLFTFSEDPDNFVLKNKLLTFERYDHILYAYVYDANWNLIERYIKPSARPTRIVHDPRYQSLIAHKKPFPVTHINDFLVCMEPIGNPEFPVGYLEVIHDFKQPIADSRHDLLITAIPLVLLILLISSIISWYMFRRILTPLIRLSAFTRQVKHTRDYTLQHSPEGVNEVLHLSQDINSMLETINQENQLNQEQNKKLRQQQASMFRLANYDHLTGLPNRRYVMETLEQQLSSAQKRHTDMAIFFFNIDSFKDINDLMGHATGDQLLHHLSRIISGCLRRDDILARLGGDDFLVVLPDLPDPDIAKQIAQTILEQLKAPIAIEQWEIHTSVSIGIAMAKASGFDIDTLISNADIAMSYSKAAGKGSYRLFKPKMLSLKRRTLQIMNLIPMALENNEFFLVYQPKVSRQGGVIGFEALIRWNNPELGFIPPSEFIPIAENGGKIGEITSWMLCRAIQDLEQIQAICSYPVVVSVNISSKDLMTPQLENVLQSALEEHHQDITRLQFEITESSYLEKFDVANQFFSRIKALGSSIALDDFGTGYSSLSYLNRIDIDTLKIDRQFVVNSFNSDKDASVLNAILDLTKQLGLHSCCEGVETEEHARYLIERGCDSLQGYYFSQPVPLADLAQAIRSSVQQYHRLFDQVRLPDHA
ncbi:putative bifunctional diguanylate cyclase/phosphodiesterase [Vibrio mangrovi]|uniref:Cyclic di-GMP phosphodiesterase Gmr n=1 Tax=Vibrio mangrovi TaxID=474394 RepID=A0A1Y6IYT8_9VIBR|nr:EAL domain-containing protein [Vibrio mangrovi]MDW6004900.1 EAL domain-containing protein [Vibrio mangrovi]SMS01662.1 Cyclic di-GMP phosphodiesterase Gmr [Vibrio mangrovi]